MENKFKVGDKVKVPKTKSAKYYGNIEESVVIKKAKELGQDFLYITGTPDYSDDVYSLDYELKEGSGDYFIESDLELYVDTKSGMVGSEWDDAESFKPQSGIDKVIVVNPTNIKVTNTAEELEEMFQKAIAPSKKEEYLRFHKEVCDRLVEITRKKNSDYSGSNDNPFANFTSVEDRGISSTEQGFLVRMNDKLNRIISFVNTGSLEVKDESVSDTLEDLANYCILFMGYLNQKKNGNSN